MALGRLLKRAALAALVALPCALSVSAAAVIGAPHAPLTIAPRFVSLPAPTTAVDFGVHLALRNRAQLNQLLALQTTKKSPLYHHWLTPAQFRASFGPTPATIARVSAFLRSQGFSVTKVETQLIHVRGSVATVQRAFKVHLGNVRVSGRTILGTREQLTVPAALSSGAGATIVSLGYRLLPQPDSRVVKPLNRYSATGPYWFDDLKQAYNYPSYGLFNGAGATIATVGYSDFNSADAAQYFGHELLGSAAGSLAPAPVPTHLVFPQSLPFDPNAGTSDEADLDVQMSAGSAPGATVIGIAAPATDAEGFLYAYSYIVDSNAADIVSTSYGECELFYLPQYNNGENFVDILYSYDDMFAQGSSQGITFIFSSGDNAGLPCPDPNYFYLVSIILLTAVLLYAFVAPLLEQAHLVNSSNSAQSGALRSVAKKNFVLALVGMSGQIATAILFIVCVVDATLPLYVDQIAELVSYSDMIVSATCVLLMSNIWMPRSMRHRFKSHFESSDVAAHGRSPINGPNMPLSSSTGGEAQRQSTNFAPPGQRAAMTTASPQVSVVPTKEYL